MLEPRQVDLPVRRKLVEQRAESRAQTTGAFKEAADWLLRVFQLFQVGKEAAGFDRLTKAGCRLLTPCVERGCSREPVKRVVDLNCVELARVIAEPIDLAQLGWIKDVTPVSVNPTGRANTDGHRLILSSIRVF